MSLPSRRHVLGAAAAAVAAASLMPQNAGLAAPPAPLKGKLRKAMIIDKLTPEALQPLKDAGFDGCETLDIVPDAEAEKRRRLVDSLGLRVHSVLRGWMSFNSDDPAKVDDTIEQTRKALRAAKVYGADAILLVPCRIGGVDVPSPAELDIVFDEKTGHVSRVVKGDDAANEKFAKYIQQQNHATKSSRKAVEKLIPLAEELKVIIGLENVWNNLWLSPALYRNFVASFDNPWVRAYFDIGNHVKYSPPQDWIHTLGKGMICKLHIKDFKINPEAKQGGRFVHPRDGDINWPAVRQALSDVEYDGWASIEDGGLPLEEFARRFDLIAAGK
jgi:hexulose-6-phosphate isomerase